MKSQGWKQLLSEVSESERPRNAAMDIANDSLFILNGSDFWILDHFGNQHKRFTKKFSFLSDIIAHPAGGRLWITEEGISSFSFLNQGIQLAKVDKLETRDFRFFNSFLKLDDKSFLLSLVPSEIWYLETESNHYNIKGKIKLNGDTYSASWKPLARHFRRANRLSPHRWRLHLFQYCRRSSLKPLHRNRNHCRQ